MSGRGKRGALAALVIAAIAAFVLLGGDEWLTLENLKVRQNELQSFAESRPFLAIGSFFLLYVAVAALSLPGAAVLTLAAGALFGLGRGTLIVSFASAIGATIAFLLARHLLRDWVRAKFPQRVTAIDRGIRRDGAFYLLTLRLIPAIPFFVINLGMGLSAMRIPTFYVVSQAGMLPGTLVFVNAGAQLAQIESLSDILSPALLGSFLLLAIFPLLARAGIRRWQQSRIYSGHEKPKSFDRNLIVIGAGAGGLVTSLVAATVKASVTLVEAHRMGGDCLNTGCVPSKALIRSARAMHEVRNASEFGIETSEPKVCFRAVMERIRAVVRQIEPADSVERYEGLGVDVRLGHARIVDPWTVEIRDRTGSTERLTTRSIVIATGAEPFVPDLPGLKDSGYLTSDTMWDELAGRDELPRRIVILGGGPIGTEMAQAFARLGSRVTQIERGDRILSKEDAEVSTHVAEQLRSEGVDVRTGHEALRCESGTLIARFDDKEVSIPFDELIVAVGRKPRLEGYGLQELGIETDRVIATNEYLETLFPNIYAVGDVAGPYQFTHFAAHQAWYAAVNALFGSVKRFKADYSVIPWVTFTDPEVAHVGHNEQSAQEAGFEYEVVRYDLQHLDRAIAEGAAAGFVKVLVKPCTDRILGATIVSRDAGELLAELALAIKHGIGLGKLLGTVHAYPTMSESVRFTAGEWKKAHKPERLLRLAHRFHAWRRSEAQKSLPKKS